MQKKKFYHLICFEVYNDANHSFTPARDQRGKLPV